MKTNAMTVLDRASALNMPHPDMGYDKKGRKTKEESSFAHFDANRTGITVLRRRDFTWAEIHNILKNFGVVHSYPSLILWKNTHFEDPVKLKEQRKLARKLAAGSKKRSA